MPRFVRTICRGLQATGICIRRRRLSEGRGSGARGDWTFYWPSWNPEIRRAPYPF
jgi:hypothetical protein